METQLLRDKDIPPTTEILQEALGNSYFIFEELIDILKNNNNGLSEEWNYYNDGKAWLCKIRHKNKTVFWLSIWDKYFKTSFFFTKKNYAGVLELNIDKKIKKDLTHGKSIGRLIPLTISITNKNQLKDLLTIIDYKRSLK